MATKLCPRCNRDLPDDAFGVDQKRPDQLTVWCRACKSEVNRLGREHRKNTPREQVERWTCSRCSVEKPAVAFHRKADSPHGLAYVCIECIHDKPKEAVATKRCTICHRELDASRFARNVATRDGLSTHCKECVTARAQQRAERNRETPKVLPESKLCTKCHTKKPASAFGRDATSRDGLLCQCLECRTNNLNGKIRALCQNAHRMSKARGKTDERLGNGWSRGECDMTREALMDKWKAQEECCDTSGFEMTPKSGQWNTVSIDRIDVTKGETIQNTNLTCVIFNQPCQMTREKLWYITHHQDAPMTDAELDEACTKYRSVFLRMIHATKERGKKQVKKAGDLTIDQLIAIYRAQRGLCAYSGVRMFLGGNLPSFQMSIERKDRNKGYSCADDNVVLILLELNVGGQTNLTRDFVQSWRKTARIRGVYDLATLTAKFKQEYEKHNAEQLKDRQCAVCHEMLPEQHFRASMGIYCRACRACRDEAHRAKHVEKKCSLCKKMFSIEFFKQNGSICRECRRDNQRVYLLKRGSVEVVDEKVCKSCEVSRDAMQFTKDKSDPTGLSSRCRECQAKRRKT